MGRHETEDHLFIDDDAPVTPLWRTRTGVGALLILLFIVGTWILFRWLSAPTNHNDFTVPLDQVSAESITADGEPTQASTSAATEPDTETETLILHVAGEIKNPGIVEVPNSSRIVDAINASGGATSAADLNSLNLASHVEDGQYIYVPAQGEDPGIAPQPAAATDPGTGTTGASDIINVNTATAEQLQELNGIGPAMSQRIIEFRETHGPFESANDLLGVSGIGPATLAKFEDQISW